VARPPFFRGREDALSPLDVFSSGPGTRAPCVQPTTSRFSRAPGGASLFSLPLRSKYVLFPYLSSTPKEPSAGCVTFFRVQFRLFFIIPPLCFLGAHAPILVATDSFFLFFFSLLFSESLLSLSRRDRPPPIWKGRPPARFFGSRRARVQNFPEIEILRAAPSVSLFAGRLL